MANRGVFRQIWSHFRKSGATRHTEERFVGHDELGNRYFEKVLGEERKPQRRVEPRDNDITNVPEVPVEWMTWLRGRRIDPPTQQEIEKNLHTMLRTQARARELDQSKQQMNVQEGADVPTQHASKSNFPQYDDMETFPGELEGSKKPER